MSHIELRDLLSGLTSSPLRTLSHLSVTVAENVASRWWHIAILVFVFLAVRRGLARVLRRTSVAKALSTEGRAKQRHHARVTMTVSFAMLLTWATFILILLGQIGLSISAQTYSWIIGSLSLTFAFAFRGYASDAIAGLTAVFGDRCGYGDYIDAGMGVSGTVIHIGMWSTRLRGADGTIYHIRNSELDRFGNRTQSSGKLVVDVELTNEDRSFVTSANLDDFEQIASSALVDLRSVLADVNAVAKRTTRDVDLPAVAKAVTALVPNLESSSIENLRAIDDDDTGVLPKITDAIMLAPVGATPMFRDIEMLGLVTSTPESVTIRLRVVLADPKSRSYALAMLHRRLFDAFNVHGVATGFSEPDEGEWIN